MLSVLTFRTPGRGGREGEQHAVRAVRRHLDREGLPHPRGWPTGCAPASSGRTRSTASTRRSPFGGYKESGFGREGGRHGLEAVPDVSSREPVEAAPRRPQDLQALHRRGVPALGVRPRPTRSLGSDGDLLANAAQASRKDARDAVVAARGASAGWAGATAYNRGQVLYRVAEMLEGRRAQFAAEVAAAEGVDAGAAAAGRRGRSTAGSGTPAGPTSSPRSPAAPTRSPGRTSTSSLPEPTGVVAIVAPQDSGAARPRQRARPGDRDRQHGRRRRQPRPPAAGRQPRRGAGHLRPAGRRRQRAHRLTAELAPWLAAHRDVNAHRPHRRRAEPIGRPCERAAADNVKRVLAAARADWTADPGIGGCAPSSRPRRSGTRSGC